MPNNNNRKKNKRNRKNGGRTTVNQLGPRGLVTVPNSPSVAALPVALRTKLRYFMLLTISAGGAGLYNEYTFRSNSLYDPDFTGTGVQPSGFAALATLYSRYRVIGAKVKITIVNDAAASSTVVFYQRPVSTPFTSIITACTQGFSKRAILSNEAGGRNQHTFTTNIRPWEVLGVSKDRYMLDDQYASAVATNPAGVAFFGIGQHGVTTAASAQIQVDVMYDAVLFDRVVLV